MLLKYRSVLSLDGTFRLHISLIYNSSLYTEAVNSKYNIAFFKGMKTFGDIFSVATF